MYLDLSNLKFFAKCSLLLLNLYPIDFQIMLGSLLLCSGRLIRRYFVKILLYGLHISRSGCNSDKMKGDIYRVYNPFFILAFLKCLITRSHSRRSYSISFGYLVILIFHHKLVDWSLPLNHRRPIVERREKWRQVYMYSSLYLWCVTSFCQPVENK